MTAAQGRCTCRFLREIVGFVLAALFVDVAFDCMDCGGDDTTVFLAQTIGGVGEPSTKVLNFYPTNVTGKRSNGVSATHLHASWDEVFPSKAILCTWQAYSQKETQPRQLILPPVVHTEPLQQRNHCEADQAAVQAAVSGDAGGDE